MAEASLRAPMDCGNDLTIVSTITRAVVRLDSRASAAFWKGLHATGALNVPMLPISIASVVMKWPVSPTATALAKIEQPWY